jgi:CelD/BcsL family acetyltransferase involved in cellulose biosynthesis
LVLLRIHETHREVTEALRLVVLTEIPEDAELRQQWNALVDRVDRPQVFYTYEWSLAVQRAYSATLHPLVLVAYDDTNSLCGIAALATGPDGHSASFLCATTGDYCDFLSESKQKSEFMNEALRELKKRNIRRIALANLPADSSTLSLLRESCQKSGFHCYARMAYICAQVSINQLERGKDGKPFAPGLKRLRRFEKAMGPGAKVRIEHRRSWEAVEPVLPEFMQAHVARFLEIGRISNLADSHRRVFLSELARVLSQSQWFVLSRMLSGERPVAWHYGFQFHGSWFWYQPTFDSSVEKHWPGFCLLSQVIQDSIEIPGMTMLDLGLGSEAYKAKFANESRETLHVSLHRSVLEHSRAIVRHKVAEAVKSSPRWERFANRARQRVRAFRVRSRDEGIRSTLGWLGKRLVRLIRARDEVFFYELTGPDPTPLQSDKVFLKQIDLSVLAAAAMQNFGDEGTMAYLVRCARRLRTEPESVGFVLTNPAGELLHFTWARPFEGFYWSELNSTLPSPSPGDAVMFDSWTPVSQRGRGYYAPTLGLAVARIRQEGKRAWGFSASTNISSVRGLEKAGFRRCFSVIRQRILWWQRIFQKNVAIPVLPDA